MAICKLRVYESARSVIRSLRPVVDGCAPTHRDLVRQLRRAASSVVLNIREGAGEWMPREKAKFYRYALRSAHETDGALDALVDWGAVKPAELERARAHLVDVIRGMTRLAAAMYRKCGDDPDALRA